MVLTGKAFSCQACNQDVFNERGAQLSTAVSSMLGLNWTNQTATCLICDNCGYIHWFMPKEPEYIDEEEPFVLQYLDDRDKTQV